MRLKPSIYGKEKTNGEEKLKAFNSTIQFTYER